MCRDSQLSIPKFILAREFKSACNTQWRHGVAEQYLESCIENPARSQYALPSSKWHLGEHIMNKVKALLLVGTIFFGLVNALAQSQPTLRIRGAVTGFDNHELQRSEEHTSELQ